MAESRIWYKYYRMIVYQIDHDHYQVIKSRSLSIFRYVYIHDVVGINCKNGATTEKQGSAVKYMG